MRLNLNEFGNIDKKAAVTIINNRREEGKLLNDIIKNRSTLSTIESEIINFYTMGVEMISVRSNGIDGKLNENTNIFFESKMLYLYKKGSFRIKISLNEKNKVYYENYKTFIIVGIWDSQKNVLVANLVGKMSLLKDDYMSKRGDLLNKEIVSMSMDVNISKLINRGFKVYAVNYSPEEVYEIIKEKSDTYLTSLFTSRDIKRIEEFDTNFYYES